MIDCHTHLWRVGEHIGPRFMEAARRAYAASNTWSQRVSWASSPLSGVRMATVGVMALRS